MKIISIMLTIIFGGCNFAPNEPPHEPPQVIAHQQISSQEAQRMMDYYDVIILDVRTQEEFDGGHIQDAIVLPYDEIAERAESVIADRQQIVLIYCRTGRRSEIAARSLVYMGFTRVYDFGGIVDWTGEIIETTIKE